MARTSTLRGWAYPDFEENPYDTTFVGFVDDMDADVNTLATAVRSVSLGGTGQSTLTAGRYLKGNGTSPVTLQATPIPVADGGTGAATLTASRFLVGNGTGAVTAHTVGIPWLGTLLSDSTTLSNTTTRTLLSKSVTIPAGTLSTVGARLAWSGRLWVTCATATTPTYEVDVFLGPSRLSYTAHAFGAVLTLELQFSGEAVIRTTGGSGTFMVGASFHGLANTYADARAGTTFSSGTDVVDTTAAQALQVYLTMSAANAANTGRLQMLNVRVEYPDLTVS
jgi:hypothetical protein